MALRTAYLSCFQKVFFLLFFCCFSFTSFSQAIRSMLIVDSLNHFSVLQGTSSRLDSCMALFDNALRSDDVDFTVLHIGGSHIQADMMTNQIRMKFDTLYHTFHSDDTLHASRGLIFPFETAHTNNPYNYTVRHTGVWVSSRNVHATRVAELGLSGIAVTTNDTAATISVNLNPKGKSKWQCSRLRLIGYADTNLVQPVLVVNDSSYSATFDSVQSVYTFQLPKLTDSFSLKIVQQDSIPHSFTVNGFFVENDEHGIVYHAVGVNGASVPSYLSCEHFERDLQLIKPNLVVFAIGINDANSDSFTDSSFIAHYDSLIARIETVVPHCAYVFITNNDSYKKIKQKKGVAYVVNKNGLCVREDCRILAQKHDGAVWDMFSIMGGLTSMKKWESFGYAQKDKVHFTFNGYVLLGNSFYKAFSEYYNAYKCSHN